MTVSTWQYYMLCYSVLGMWLARLYIREPVPALTSDPEYPVILNPESFGPAEQDYLATS